MEETNIIKVVVNKMTKSKAILSPTVLSISFGISLIIALCGSFVFPIFFDAGMKDSNGSRLSVGSLIVLASFFLMVFLFALLFRSLEEKRKRKLSSLFGGLLSLFVIGFAAMLLLSMLYGLLAMLIYAICKDALTGDQIKGVINVAIGIITLSVLPIALNIFFTYALTGQKVLRSISEGLRTLKKQYLRLLLILAILFAVGFLAVLPFNYASDTLPLQIAKTIVTAVIGAVGIVVFLKSYKPIHPKN